MKTEPKQPEHTTVEYSQYEGPQCVHCGLEDYTIRYNCGVCDDLLCEGCLDVHAEKRDIAQREYFQQAGTLKRPRLNRHGGSRLRSSSAIASSSTILASSS